MQSLNTHKSGVFPSLSDPEHPGENLHNTPVPPARVSMSVCVEGVVSFAVPRESTALPAVCYDICFYKPNNTQHTEKPGQL